MGGLCSNPCDVPRVAYDEEADGDIGMFGTGALSGCGVGGDTHMLGPGRSSGDNHDHEDINRNGIGSIGPISTSGNTIHEDHCGDLTKPLLSLPSFPLSPITPHTHIHTTYTHTCTHTHTHTHHPPVHPRAWENACYFSCACALFDLAPCSCVLISQFRTCCLSLVPSVPFFQYSF